MRKTIFLTVMVLLCLSLIQPALAFDNVSDSTAVFKEILEYVYENHLDTPELDTLINGAFNGMLNSLNDPYSEYLTQDNYDSLKFSLNGDFVGVGILLGIKDSLIYAEEVIVDSPAFKAGVKKDDILLTVDGKDISGFSIVDVVHMIRGPKGSSVVINILRGNKRINISVKRDIVNMPTVEFKMLKDKTGYVIIESFGSDTGKEFSRAIASLRSSGMSSLILDLRNNTGGYLLAAIEIAGHFIKHGDTVVKVVDRNGKEEVFYSEGKAEIKGLPVAILTNELTASASEVLLGALHDYKLAVSIGDRTYGKGVVQNVIALDSGEAIKLTVAKYLTPLEHDLNLVGLKPDVAVLTTSLQLPIAQQLLNPPTNRFVEFNVGQQKVLVNGGEIEVASVPFVSDGRVYVPLRFALEALLYEVAWVSEDSEDGININGYNNTLVLFPNKKLARLNGQDTTLSSGVMIKEGVSYIPVKDLQVLNIVTTVNNGKIRLVN